MKNNKHYGDKEGLLVLSYNGIITAVLTNRNYGKTWTFKKRAFRRAQKYGKKTIRLRMFQKEKKETIDTFYNSKDLQKYCGVSIYDKDTNPNGNLKQLGNTFYTRQRNKKTGKWGHWFWFLKAFKLSDDDAIRSADDVDVDTLIFDEATKTADKYKRFRGNIVNNFIDILFSSKREHAVRCIILGNRESYNNPFFTYFGIKPLPKTFEGIRTFRHGSFVVQQINNKQKAQNDYDKKMFFLLEGTPYGNYIYNDAYKQETGFKPRKMPNDASIYCQLIFNKQPIKICIYNGFFYVNSKIENTRRIYCDALPHKYAHELLLVKKQKRFFTAFINALADNRVYYENELVYEALTPFFQWLTI